MSSPQMTRMLGFLSAACTGRGPYISAAAAVSTVRLQPMSLSRIMVVHLVACYSLLPVDYCEHEVARRARNPGCREGANDGCIGIAALGGRPVSGRPLCAMTRIFDNYSVTI